MQTPDENQQPKEPTYITRSLFYKRAAQKAFNVASDQSKILSLLQKVAQKSEGKNMATDLKNKLFLLARMVKALVKGQYKELPWATAVRIVAVLIYFVAPIDLIPDFLPVIGFVDDITLVFWLFQAISADIDKFEVWEKQATAALPPTD
jgi:uncharacterized membrane protein YkvA (DUF1232 family)